MCVESVTTGSPHQASTLKRCGSTGMTLDMAAMPRGKFRELREQFVAHALFVFCDGLDVHQRPR